MSAYPGDVLSACTRRYALQLMEAIIPAQRWGVTCGPWGTVCGPPGYAHPVPGVTVALKNGWKYYPTCIAQDDTCPWHRASAPQVRRPGSACRCPRATAAPKDQGITGIGRPPDPPTAIHPGAKTEQPAHDVSPRPSLAPGETRRANRLYENYGRNSDLRYGDPVEAIQSILLLYNLLVRPPPCIPYYNRRGGNHYD